MSEGERGGYCTKLQDSAEPSVVVGAVARARCPRGPRPSSGHHFFFACPTWGHLGHHRGSRRLCSVISAFSPCRRWGTPRASPHLGLAPGGAITVMPVRGPRGHRARATAPSTLAAPHADASSLYELTHSKSWSAVTQFSGVLCVPAGLASGPSSLVQTLLCVSRV